MKTITRITTSTAIATGILAAGVLATGPAMATEGTKPAFPDAQAVAAADLSPEQVENAKTIIQVGKDNGISRQGI